MDINLLILNAISSFKSGADISNLLDEINANEAELSMWWHEMFWNNDDYPKWTHHFAEQSDIFGDPEDIKCDFEENMMSLADDLDILNYIEKRIRNYVPSGTSPHTLEEIYYNDVFIRAWSATTHFDISYSGFSISLSDNTIDWLGFNSIILHSDKFESSSKANLVTMFKYHMSKYVTYPNIATGSINQQ